MPEFYDAEYADQEFLREDFVMFLEEGCEGWLKICEIGVGTARAAIPIAKAGHKVIGVDIDTNLLKMAEEKRDAAGLSEEQLSFVQADVTREKWADKVGGDYDAAAIFFNTFLAFAKPEHQEHVLRQANKILQPGGVLWIDIFNPDLTLITGAIGGVQDLEPALFRTADGRTVQRLTSLYANVTKQIQHVTFHYRWFENDDERTADSSFDMTWITPRELERLLRLCGFQVEAVWGDYERADLDDDAPRQIVMARKLAD